MSSPPTTSDKEIGILDESKKGEISSEQRVGHEASAASPSVSGKKRSSQSAGSISSSPEPKKPKSKGDLLPSLAEKKAAHLVKFVLELQKKTYKDRIISIRVLNSDTTDQNITKQFVDVAGSSCLKRPCFYILLCAKETIKFEDLLGAIDKGEDMQPVLPIYVGQTSNFQDRFRSGRDKGGEVSSKHHIIKKHERNQERLFREICG